MADSLKMEVVSHTAPETEARTIEIEVFRYNPETDAEPYFQSFKVPFTHDTSVLQGLQYIKDHLDGSLTFRWSCRMAICGSCGKMIDGKPELSCHKFLREYDPGPVRIEPLSHFPVLRDLAIDQRDFFERALPSVKPYIVPKEDKAIADGSHVQTPAQFHKYYQYSQCINCLLCYAACPQYGLKPGFTGPAALALLHRYNADSRDKGFYERSEVLNAEQGVWDCTLVGYCSEVCPKHVDPAHAINQNKVNSTMDYFGVMKLFMPKGDSA